ncbi:MAG: hypothetical protein KDK27_00345 [Leptospiraceae bacterium]|nr:hypothetical protein [Leptospiraceae bacterium]
MTRRQRFPTIYWRDIPVEDHDILRSRNTPSRYWANVGTRLKTLLQPLLRPFKYANEQVHTHDFYWQSLIDDVGGRTTPDRPRLADPALTYLDVHECDGGIHSIECVNRRNFDVLIPAGSAFLGGAQNRMLTDAGLIPAGARQNLSVFCIEAGRWQSEQRDFHRLSQIPDFMRQIVLSLGREGEVLPETLQYEIWKRNMDVLLLKNGMNATIDLMGHIGTNDETEGVAAVPAPLTPTLTPSLASDARGYYYGDARTGLAGISILPDYESARTYISEHIPREIIWRQKLRSNVNGAREFFRIFDAEKKLAMRCLSDGTALKDMRGRYLLMPYEEQDLANSFQPPLETPPAAPELEFSFEKMYPDAESFLADLSQCGVRIRPVRNTGTHRFDFGHPQRAIGGSGMIHNGELLYLDAKTYRPFASV